MRRAPLPALCLLASCAQIERIELLRCGNAVIEPALGEDCDLFPGGERGGPRCGRPEEGARACRFVCALDAEPCPAGWSCGPEGVCRHGLGRFEFLAASSLAIAADRALRGGDFDGDGRLDVASADGAALEVRFGAGGAFEDPVREVSLPEPPFFLDLDPDGRTDIVLATPGGLYVTRGQEDRTFAPVPYPQVNLDRLLGEVLAVRVTPLQLPGELVHRVVALVGNRFGTCFQRPCTPASADLRDVDLGDLAGRIPHGRVLDAATESMALAFRGDNRLYLVSWANAQDLAPPLAINLPGQVAGPAMIGDLDGDGREDVVLAVRSGGTTRAAVVLGGPAPTVMQSAAFDRWLAPEGGSPDPENVLAVGDFSGDGVADLVLKKALVFGGASGTLFPLDELDGELVAAVAGDFNRDLLPDLAVVRADTVGIDVLFGTGQPVYNPAFVPTASPVVALRTGDFDGDQVGDLIALSEDRGRASVSLLRGRLQGAPGPEIAVGSFRHVLGVEPLFDENGDNDLINDLMVASSSEPDGQGVRSLAILAGAADGRLRSGLGLLSSGLSVAPRPWWVRGGRFAGEDEVPDLLVCSSNGPWLLPGGGAAEFDPERMVRLAPAPELGCTGAELTPALRPTLTAQGCAAGELLPGEGGDRLLLLRGERCGPGQVDGGAVRLGVGGASASTPPVLLLGELLLRTGGLRPLAQARVTDLDQDGRPDLLLVHPAPPDSEANASGAQGGAIHLALNLSVAAQGDRLSVRVDSEQSLPVGRGPLLDAVALQADADPELEVALLTVRAVLLADRGADGRWSVGQAPVSREHGDRLLAGDLDGDGLTDLVLVGEDRLLALRLAAHDDGGGR